MTSRDTFLLQRVQPALTGLIDGSLSTIAPIFAVALYTHEPHAAFIAGTATAIAAGVSMAYSEGLSDTGELTGRGSPLVRGPVTGRRAPPGACPAPAALPEPELPRGARRRRPRRGLRARRGRVAALALLPDELRRVARLR